MNVAFFDLDGTLLKGDTDIFWGEVLARHGVFDKQTTEAFKIGYSTGDLDAEDFVARFLSPIVEHGHDSCIPWLKELLKENVYPALRKQMLGRLENHRAQNHELVLATATNEFLTRPIAAHLNIPTLLSSPAEIREGKYTGKPSGPACFKGQKLVYATEWLREKGSSWEAATTWFYSDSIHDLPLLEAVDHAIAVDPDEPLESIATGRGWEIIRDTDA